MPQRWARRLDAEIGELKPGEAMRAAALAFMTSVLIGFTPAAMVAQQTDGSIRSSVGEILRRTDGRGTRDNRDVRVRDRRNGDDRRDRDGRSDNDRDRRDRDRVYNDGRYDNDRARREREQQAIRYRVRQEQEIRACERDLWNRAKRDRDNRGRNTRWVKDRIRNVCEDRVYRGRSYDRFPW
jgi:hypothetical protein